MSNCKYCFVPLERIGIGRAPVYCSNACKQASYRLTKVGSHFVAERNRLQLRRESLRIAGGADFFN